MVCYAFAKEILETCLTLGILQAVGDGVAVYHAASKEDPENFPEGWYEDSKEEVIAAIMHDPEASICLREALVRAGYQYDEREKFWKDLLSPTNWGPHFSVTLSGQDKSGRK